MRRQLLIIPKQIQKEDNSLVSNRHSELLMTQWTWDMKFKEIGDYSIALRLILIKLMLIRIRPHQLAITIHSISINCLTILYKHMCVLIINNIVLAASSQSDSRDAPVNVLWAALLFADKWKSFINQDHIGKHALTM